MFIIICMRRSVSVVPMLQTTYELLAFNSKTTLIECLQWSYAFKLKCHREFKPALIFTKNIYTT